MNDYTQLHTVAQVNEAIRNRMEVEYNPFPQSNIDAAPRSGQWRAMPDFQMVLLDGTYRARYPETAR